MADQYEELRRLAEEATPGPWRVDQDERPRMHWNRSIDDSANKTVCFMAHSDGKDDAGDKATADFIAAANPQTIAALLAELDALREDARRMRHAGAMLSNCAFNLAQRNPGQFTARDIEALDSSRKAWDAALHPSKDADSGEVGNG